MVRSQGVVLIVLAGGLLAPAAVAQIPPDTTGAGISVEALLEDLNDETGDPTQLAELLAGLQDHPVDVNRAGVDELAQIPAFGLALARNVVRFREAFGPFDDLADLASVEGITGDVLADARPYLTADALPTATASRFGPTPSLGDLLADLRFEAIQRATRRLDLGRGYDDDSTGTAYVGSPDRLYTRLRVRSRRNLSLNLTLEKDPGERFRWDPASRTYGYDHTTAHLALRDVGRIEALIVGDYVADWGQGVVLWRSSALGKGREPVRPIARAGRGLAPYGGAEENSFFRGVAATVRLTPGLSASAFASRRRLDARTIEPDTTAGTTADALFEDRGEATTLSLSGLHRTPAELEKKDAVREDLLGAHLGYRSASVRLGVVGYRSRFDRPFRPGDQPYERYRFAGSEAAMVGGYAGVFWKEMHLFGEAARAPEGAMGGVAGLAMRFLNQAEAVMLARHYPRDFTSLHGHAFGERNGATQNEMGYYLGVQLRPHPHWRVAAAFDQYRFPWVRFGVPRPGTGYEVRLLVEHRPRRWLTVYVQGRSETQEAGVRHTDGQGRVLDALRLETRQSLRLHGDYQFSPSLRLRARLEAVRFAVEGAGDDYGVVLYQDVRWLPARRLQLDVRVAFFDADSFDARVFAYENDLRYTFSVPSFSGRGQRAYVLAQWTPSDRLTLQAKAAATRWEDVRSVGSGLDTVAGNRLREVRTQLQWRF